MHRSDRGVRGSSRSRKRAKLDSAMAEKQPKRKRSEAGKIKKKNYDRERAKTRVNIGVAHRRWRELRVLKGLKTDSDVAFFLLDSYERALETPNATAGKDAHTPAASRNAASNGARSSHGVSHVEEDMRENVYNDPVNSVIDWADEDSSFCHDDDDDEEEDGSSEESIPTICMRMGGALNKAPSIDGLPVIGIEETVHDQPAREEPPVEPPDCDQAPGFLSEEDVIGAKTAIVYEDCLGQLATFLTLPVDKCTGRLSAGVACSCVAPFEISVTSRGTAMSVEWICLNGHVVWRWNSQPVMGSGMQAGDFLLSANILLSGSSYAKVALLFRFMNMGMVSEKAFGSVQDHYCVDTVKDFWEERRAEALGRLRGKDVVVIAGGRNYLPRHRALYRSYSAMENDTKEILHVSTIDGRQTPGNSAAAEKEGFIETVDALASATKLVEVCTDAHGQIEALANAGRYKARGLHHSVDMWHGAKNLAKRITAAAKRDGQSTLLDWLKDIVDHFWRCCKTADTPEKFLAEWVGITHHVCGSHTWPTGRCRHGDLDEPPGKEWIPRDSECHKALTDIVLDQCWQKDVVKYLRCRSTIDLETFHNHVLMYTSKHSVFSRPVYEARVLLAALDYNFHRNRPTIKTAQGKEIFRRLYKRNVGRYGVYALREEKSYKYIPELQARIVERTTQSGVGRPRRINRRPYDSRGFRLVPPAPAPVPVSVPIPAPAPAPTQPERMQPQVRERIIVQQVLVIKAEDPESLDIKEEQEERLWTNRQGEQPRQPGRADSNALTSAAVRVKSEDEEEPLDRGGLEAARSSAPRGDVKPDPDSSETETGDDDWLEHFSGSEPETDDSDSWTICEW